MQRFWTSSALVEPPRTFPAIGYERPGVEALYFESEPYHGKATRVFAWIGLPYLEEGQTCPAMVLLHGGGGTAFDEWVRIWNRRGYAAIAFDQCGCVPENPAALGGAEHERHRHGGPPGWDASFAHTDEPIEEQWQYHAVAAAMRAHSLLAAQPGVDPNRFGVTGISWGGYLTCLVAGIDLRYRCAIPVYGCGYLGDNSVWKDTVFPTVDSDVVNRWLELWDPSVYLPQADVPFCWLNGTNDLAYPLDSFQKSYSLPPSARTLCIRVEMPHSHPDGWAPSEIGVFADSHLNHGAPLPRIRRSAVENGRIRVEFESPRPVTRAELCYTRATGHWGDRKYNIVPAHLDTEAGFAEAEVPKGTTVGFINIYDDRDCLVSGEIDMK